MKQFKVYGSGCSNCVKTAELIAQAAAERGEEIALEKVTDMKIIALAGVMKTPGVGLDGRIIHFGSVPTAERVRSWFD